MVYLKAKSEGSLVFITGWSWNSTWKLSKPLIHSFDKICAKSCAGLRWKGGVNLSWKKEGTEHDGVLLVELIFWAKDWKREETHGEFQVIQSGFCAWRNMWRGNMLTLWWSIIILDGSRAYCLSQWNLSSQIEWNNLEATSESWEK